MTPLRPEDKVLTRAQAVARYGSAARRGSLVFTNGVFDVLHRGHVAYLDAARRLGEALVVGMNSDASVKRLKGAERPLVTQDDRAYVLAALASVDAVTIFDEDTPLELIRALEPDVLVKGGDYAPDQVVGRPEVEARGGRLVLIPLVEGRSTTSLVQRIRGEGQ